MNAVANALIEHDEKQVPAAKRDEPRQLSPSELVSYAIQSGQPIDIIREAIALSRELKREQAREAFDDAMASAKAEIPTIRKNRTVDFTSSKGRTHYRHEDLAEVVSTVSPILSKFGLSHRFKVRNEPNEPIVVTCVIAHRLGYFEETTLTGPRDDSGNKNAIQQVGSTLTYLQRMTLKAALGLAASDEDDDGRKSDEPAGSINPEQVAKVRTLIEETGSDIEQFCKYMGVPAVTEITTAELPRALAMLERKKRQATNG